MKFRMVMVMLLSILVGQLFAHPRLGMCFDYIEGRKHTIVLRSGQFKKHNMILLGDSLIDSMVIPAAEVDRVINCGISGATVKTVADVVDPFVDAYSPSCVFLCIGVNDTINSSVPFDLEVFKRQYSSACYSIMQKNINLVISTVLPVEKNKTEGVLSFNQDAILSVNEFIRKFARDNNIKLVDSFGVFQENNYMPKGRTIDGVHLTAESYSTWKEILFGFINKNCQIE